jgi:DNA-binding protein HU-beta
LGRRAEGFAGEQDLEGAAQAVEEEDPVNNADLQGVPRKIHLWSACRESKRETPMAKLMTKSQLIEKIAAEHSALKKRDVKGVLETLTTIGYKELKKAGAFLVPGFARFVVIKKPATKARKGINPFTKEPTIFKAKPARKIVKARPVKAAKDAV